jgi:MFS family permease
MQDTIQTRISTRPRWAVAAMFFANGFILGGWAPQIPLFLTRLGITETTLGLLLVGFGLGALVAMPSAGFFISRYGSRATLKVAAIACAPALLLVVAVPNLTVAVFAFIAFGAVFGGMDVTMNANAVAVERRLDRAIMSSSHGFWSLGGFVGGASGGYLIEAFGPLGHAAIVSAIALLLVLLSLPHIITEELPGADQKARGGWPRGATIYLLGVVALFAMIPEGAVVDWGALYLAQDFGATVATGGFGYAAFAGAMAIMRFRRRRYARPFRRRQHAARIGWSRRGDVGRCVCAGCGCRHRLLRRRRSWHRQYRPCHVFGRWQPAGHGLRRGHERRHNDGLFGHSGRAFCNGLCR